jgi:hypothetical protein
MAARAIVKNILARRVAPLDRAAEQECREQNTLETANYLIQ